MTVFTLTTDPDTFVGGSEDDTVNGTAATLNLGDRLTGGGGNDVLARYGSGTFRVSELVAPALIRLRSPPGQPEHCKHSEVN